MSGLLKGIFLFITIVTSSSLFAQKNELGFGLGVFNYRGEIAPSFNILNSRPGMNFFYRRNFNPFISLKLGATVGLIHASDENGNQPVNNYRKAEFSGFLTEGALTFEYNFFNYIVNYRDRGNVNKFSPYLTGGLGFFYPQVSGPLLEQDFETKAKLVLPIGIGFKYMLGNQWNFGAEVVARRTFTDRLDGLSNTYVNKKLYSDPVNVDYYYFIGLSLSYTFYKIHCPK